MTKTGRLMSRATAVVLGALLLAAVPSHADDQKVALYAGYAFFKTDDGNLNGGRLSPEYRLNGFASIVGDFSFEKGTLAKSDTTIVTYLGGLRIRRGLGSLSVFAHALAGGVRTTASVAPFSGVKISVTESGLGLDGGGGLEFKVTGSLKMRVGADYLRRKINVAGGKTANENDIRATVGFVF